MKHKTAENLRPANSSLLGILWPAGQGRRLIVLLAAILSASCKETILHDLDELRANQAKVILSQNGIESDKERDGKLWTVSVASRDANRALLAVEESRILKRDLSNLREQSTSLVKSREERLYLLERSLAASLESTLESLPNVLEARVHLNTDEERAFDKSPSSKGGTASVLIVARSSALPYIPQVRTIVAGASGLAETSVSVVAVKRLESQTAELKPSAAERDANKGMRTGSPQKERAPLYGLGALALSLFACLFIAHALRRRMEPFGQSGTETQSPSGKSPPENLERAFVAPRAGSNGKLNGKACDSTAHAVSEEVF